MFHRLRPPRLARAAGAVVLGVALLGAVKKPTRTPTPAPTPKLPAVQKIAVGASADQGLQQPIWESIFKWRPDLFVFAGDAVTVPDVPRPDFRAEFRKLANVPGFHNVRKLCPMLAVWDDGEYGGRDGTYDPARKEEARTAFLDFFGEPADSPRRKRAGVYDARVFGPAGRRVQVILLDTRWNRTPLKKRPLWDRATGPFEPLRDPSATFLGAEQWAFLREELKKPAEIRLLVSPIQVLAEDHGFEKWMNIPAERDYLFSVIKDTKAEGVVFLSGDRHFAELSSMDGGVGYPLFDLTTSGLNEGAYNVRPNEENQHRVGNPIRGNNFGGVLVDWSAPDPRIELHVYDESGTSVFLYTLELSDLRVGPKPGAGGR